MAEDGVGMIIAVDDLLDELGRAVAELVEDIGDVEGYT